MRGRSWAASVKIAIRGTPNLPNYCAISCNIHISYKYVRGPRVRYLGSKRPRKCMKVLYSTDNVHLKATSFVRPSTEYNKLHFTLSVSNVILFIYFISGWIYIFSSKSRGSNFLYIRGRSRVTHWIGGQFDPRAGIDSLERSRHLPPSRNQPRIVCCYSLAAYGKCSLNWIF